jgi:hypothetical protein
LLCLLRENKDIYTYAHIEPSIRTPPVIIAQVDCWLTANWMRKKIK